LEYYVEGAKRSDLDSIVLAAELFASGELGEQKHDLAIPLYGEAAYRGSALAQRRLGAYYTDGKEVERDLKLASELYEAAAEQGDENAAYALGAAYERGNEAVPRDLGQAIRWYRVAAEKGLTIAQHNLACCYAHPDSPLKDMPTALMWFHKAAEGGSKLTMENLAHMYANGWGVDMDLEKAAYWRDRAAVAPEMDPITGRAADPTPGGSGAGEKVSPKPREAVEPADGDPAFTDEEERQWAEMINRIRAIMRELNGDRSLQAFVVADLLATLLAHCKEEGRQRILEQVLEWARQLIPGNERLLEEARRQRRQ
jgi:hypothetical protein